jgi:hypothetical protein
VRADFKSDHEHQAGIAVRKPGPDGTFDATGGNSASHGPGAASSTVGGKTS